MQFPWWWRGSVVDIGYRLWMHALMDGEVWKRKCCMSAFNERLEFSRIFQVDA
jgi:hypothetical protein